MASRNDVTCDVLANVKGNADAYAEGWDRIFGKKDDTPVLTTPDPLPNEPLTPPTP